MFENIAYICVGFGAAFFALESAWHFMACKIHDKSIKLCFYKQVGLLIIMASIERSRRIRRRTRSLKMKTNPSLSKATELERIITRDGFSYFLIAND